MLRARHLVSVAAIATVLGVSARGSSEPQAHTADVAKSSAALVLTNDHVAEIEAAIRSLASASSLHDGQLGVAVIDVDTGHLLAAQNEHAPLNPASNAKLYTAAAALAILHGEHRYETSLAGVLKSGAIEGPLVLRGFGDPSLVTEDLASIVDELRARGVHRVSGDILVDQRFFDEHYAPPAFDQQPNEWAYFRAPVSAVALNENTVTLTIRPTTEGSPALATFDPLGFVDVDGAVRTGAEGADTVGLALTPNGKRLGAKLSGAVGAGAKIVRYTRRVEDPSLLAGYALRALLERAEIKVTGDVKLGFAKGAPVIATHESAPLSQLLFQLGKASDNFYAEMIFKSLGGESKAHPARSEDGAEVVSRFLDKIAANDAGMIIKNGSGLFDANRVTAASVVSLLRYAARDRAIAPEFIAQLSIGGVDGTLHKRFLDQKKTRTVRAKTGTLDDAIALSGYVSVPPGKGGLAFAVIWNHVEGHVSNARVATDAFVEKLVAYENR